MGLGVYTTTSLARGFGSLPPRIFTHFTRFSSCPDLLTGQLDRVWNFNSRFAAFLSSDICKQCFVCRQKTPLADNKRASSWGTDITRLIRFQVLQRATSAQRDIFIWRKAYFYCVMTRLGSLTSLWAGPCAGLLRM